MRPIVTMKVGDREVKGIEQDFEIEREDWSRYKLLDGGVVRLKTTVAKIFRQVDDQGQPQLNPDGSPAVIVRHKSDIASSQ